MRRSLVVLALFVAAFLLLAGLAVALNAQQRSVRLALREAAEAWNRSHPDRQLRPLWLDALGHKESGWRPATNMSGKDGERGGAWGPTQITQLTARAHGYTGAMAALNSDPRLAAEWTVKILAAANPRTFADVVGWWNAGVRDADPENVGLLTSPKVPRLTSAAYWPGALYSYGLAAVTAHRLRGAA